MMITKCEAITLMRSIGMSKEQVNEVLDAFKPSPDCCNTCLWKGQGIFEKPCCYCINNTILVKDRKEEAPKKSRKG